MLKWCPALVVGASILASCSNTSPAPANQFPATGAYDLTVTEVGHDDHYPSKPLDASTQQKLIDLIMTEMDGCSGEPDVAGGKIAAQLSCEIMGRTYAMNIAGSYSPTSIDMETTLTGGSLGPHVETRHYKLVKPFKL